MARRRLANNHVLDVGVTQSCKSISQVNSSFLVSGASVLTLGVETSGLVGAVALRRGGETLDALSLEQVGRRHAQTLIAEVGSLLNRHGISPQQIEVVAVSVGPGSFTGLRVGIVFAKTLAFALGCRLVAVDTFRIIAATCPADVSQVFVVADAQRGDLFVGHYLREATVLSANPTSWIRHGDITIEPSEGWCQNFANASGSMSVVAGPAAELLRSRLPTHVRVLDEASHEPHAGMVAELGEKLAKASEFADPWTLEPFYLRRSAAEEKAANLPTDLVARNSL